MSTRHLITSLLLIAATCVAQGPRPAPGGWEPTGTLVIDDVADWERAISAIAKNPVRPDDGLRSDAGDARFRVYRGGGFVNVPRMGRSSARHYGEPGAQENDVGVRPMRRVTVE